MYIRLITVLLLLFLTAQQPATAQDAEIIGAGATFPYPLYSKMVDAYFRQNGVRINYQPIGSGGGILQLINRTVDFGATEAFMNEEELRRGQGEILHIPICVGAVIATYNLPGNPVLRFTPDIIADIFLGNITNWNDTRIRKVNPDIEFPDLDIAVVHRADGSGTTYIFSDYLSKVNRDWSISVGTGKSLDWPVGIGTRGNAGVAAMIKRIPGSIGYVELIYALMNEMPSAPITNRFGNTVMPSISSLAEAVKKLPDITATLTNTGAKYGYPIGSFSWIIIYKEQHYNDREKQHARRLVDFLWWAIHEGQQYTTPLYYSPLTEEVVAEAESLLRSVTYDGIPLLEGR